MTIKGVLFDFGGTLLDYRKEEVFGALLEEKGIRVGPERITRAYDVVEQEWKRNLPDNLKRVLLDPSEIVFVGDDLEADYRGASNAGMGPILIDRSGKYRELAGINRLSSLEELHRLLE